MSEAPVFFTIVSANYLAYAITLMQSVRQHHPAAGRYVVLADELGTDLGVDPALFTVIPVRDLGIPHLAHFALRYSVLEFNTAIKPFAVRWLAVRHPDESVVYLDPDIYVVAPLVEVLAATSSGALAVVTPHLTAPLTDDKRPDEQAFLRVGAYNLGFIALGAHPARSSLVDWWADKLERSAYVDLEAGLFTDQKWIDLVPGLFPDVRILRHPGYNLAYWNLVHRPVTTGSDGQLLAAGEPVAFVHFSGVDVHHPDAFSVHQNRFDASHIGGLRGLYDRYLELLRENGYERYARVPYAWARLRTGTLITAEMRAIFRQRFDVGRPEEQADPFGLSDKAFAERISLPNRLIRFALRQYPRVRGSAPVRLAMNRVGPSLRWTIRRFMTQRAMPPSVRAGREAAREAALGLPTARPSGLELLPRANVIGYFKGEFGVAEAARSLVGSARSSGVEVALINVPAAATAREQDLRLAEDLDDVAPHRINVICVNADQTELVMASLGPRIVDGHYNVGVWFWELGRFPAAWLPAMDRLDEIWVATEFVRASVEPATSKPVRTIRMAVDAAPSRPYRRSEFGLPDDAFLFLFSFDFSSYVARKNPLATIAAFRAAFPAADDRAGLVLKSTNGNRDRDALRRLREATEGDARIRILDGFLSRDQVFGLESVVDSYVSLHRSEGFGLGLAESMALGKPVIATGYSGNMEFMDAGNSCLVTYRLVDVKPGEYPHAEGQVWADPDIDQAVYYLRRLVDDPMFAQDLGRRAREHMAREFSAKAVGSRIAGELTRILARRRGA